MMWKNGVDPAIFMGPLKHLLSSDSNSTYMDGSCCYGCIGSLTDNPTPKQVCVSCFTKRIEALYLIWRLLQLLVY